MSRKAKVHCGGMFYLISLVFVFGLASNASSDPNLVAYYRLDGDARDTGNVFPPANGSLCGNPTWTTGRIGGSIYLDGDDYVDCSNALKFDITDEITLACWIKTTSGRAWQTITTKVGGSYEGIYRLNFDSSGNNVFFTCEGVPPYNAWGDVPVNDGRWHHLAGVYDGSKLYLYVDGVEDISANASGSIQLSLQSFLIGGYNGYNGLIDDVQLYNRGLSTEEIPKIMKGLRVPALAYKSDPADGETDVPRDAVLSWTPGEYADKHDVYFGTVFNDVNDASRTNPLGVLVSQNQEPNSYSPAKVLQWEQTYYWRVDEVNAPPDFTVYKGDVWQFTVEPIAYPIAGTSITATASSSNSANERPENTINGSGLGADDLHSAENKAMWLSSMIGPQPTWIQYEFDRVYKLHQMLLWNHNTSLESVIGFGIKEAAIEYSTDGANWTTLGTTQEFARAPGVPGYAHNTNIDLIGVVAKYIKLTAKSNWGGIFNQYGLSEVRFFYLPVLAREPNPASGATGISVDNVTFSWRPGREAAKHNVYISSSQQAVIDGTAPVTTVSQASYGPVSFDLGKAYYWRVDEVNEAEIPATWQGDVWNFSTQEYLVVDDFEDYNDFEPDRIFDTWIDGWADPANGSQVGYAEPPFAEKTIIHSGKQSMPLSYDNSTTASYSEATANVANLAIGKDWTKYGIKTLTLYFYGDPANAVERMYVKLNGSKVAYDGAADNLRRTAWQPWNIELSSFGVNLRNVTELKIGFERSGAVGGKGKVYFDDIRLYPPAQ